MKRVGAKLLVLMLGFFPPAAFSQVFFTAQIDSSQSVPVTTTNATGTLWAVLDPASQTLTYRVTYANLDSQFTAAHFHLGAPGTNGGVVTPITFTGNTAQGQWTDIPDSLIDDMMKGDIYINIHSKKYPAGEIRGQLKMTGGVALSMSLDGSQDVPVLVGSGYRNRLCCLQSGHSGVDLPCYGCRVDCSNDWFAFSFGRSRNEWPRDFPVFVQR